MPLLKRILFVTCVVFICVVTSCETEASGTSEIPLSGPQSIQVTARNQELVVQWTKVAMARGVTPTYELHYSTSSTPGSTWVFVDTNTSNLIQGTITGLTNHQFYYIWVRAVFEGLGKSNFSPPAYVQPIPPPQMPGNITVSAGHQMLELGWAEVQDAFTYEVYYSTSSGSEPPAGAEMKTIADLGVVLHGLTNSTPYNIWLRATNTAGVSGYKTNNGTPSTGGAPSAPTNVTAAGGDKKVTVSWSQVQGVPQYVLYCNTTNDFSSATTGPTVLSAAPKNSADITGLSNGVTYYVWVKSSNGVGLTSSESTFASAVTAAKPPINFNTSNFVLGMATAEYIFAQDVPTSAFFPGGRPSTDRLTRVQETALGNLFADGAVWYLRNKLGKAIEFVFINGGYIDNGILRGNLTVGSLAGIVEPDARYSDKFVIITMSGAELKKFFYDPQSETSAEKWNNDRADVAGVVHTGRGSLNTGFFGVVSSEVRYTIQYPTAPPATPALDNNQFAPYYRGRIKEGTLKLNGEDIVDSTMYRFATTDYLASGMYFTGLYTGRTSIELIDVLFWRGVAEYIYDKGTITPYLDGRIKIEGGVPLPAPWVNSEWIPNWLN